MISGDFLFALSIFQKKVVFHGVEEKKVSLFCRQTQQNFSNCQYFEYTFTVLCLFASQF